MASDGYVDRSAMGEAPLGHMPQGQKAGDKWPGGCAIPIDKSHANPSDNSARLAALNATMPGGSDKRDAGKDIMKDLLGGRRGR